MGFGAWGWGHTKNRKNVYCEKINLGMVGDYFYVFTHDLCYPCICNYDATLLVFYQNTILINYYKFVRYNWTKYFISRPEDTFATTFLSYFAFFETKIKESWKTI